MNYYELLEISPAASVEVIKNSYKALAKKYHPDTYKGDRDFAEEKMKLLNEAISVLESEMKRKEYDMINGIYKGSYLSDKSGKSDDYYSDIESRLNINVDENGEPIFFSSDNYDDSYMDTIDDFISGKESGKKSKSKSKDSKSARKSSAISFYDMDLDNISKMSKTGSINDINDISDINDIDDSDIDMMGSYDEIDDDASVFKTFNLLKGKNKRSKNTASTPQWYYILCVSLIAGTVFFAFMVIRAIDWSNISDMIAAFSGNSDESDDAMADEDANADNTYDAEANETSETDDLQSNTTVSANEQNVQNTQEKPKIQSEQFERNPDDITTADNNTVNDLNTPNNTDNNNTIINNPIQQATQPLTRYPQNPIKPPIIVPPPTTDSPYPSETLPEDETQDYIDNTSATEEITIGEDMPTDEWTTLIPTEENETDATDAIDITTKAPVIDTPPETTVQDIIVTVPPATDPLEIFNPDNFPVNEES